MPRVSVIVGRPGSSEGAVRERGIEVTVDTEPRVRLRSKSGGAMKSSASIPGAI